MYYHKVDLNFWTQSNYVKIMKGLKDKKSAVPVNQWYKSQFWNFCYYLEKIEILHHVNIYKLEV